MLNEMFKEVARGYKGDASNDDYKAQFDNGNQDSVIAHIYKNGYNLFVYTANQYIGIDSATQEDIILTQIWKCLNNYDASKSNGKLTTMICTYVRNECRRYTEEQNTQRQVINQGHKSTVFSAFEDTDRLESMGIDASYEYIEMVDYINSLDLSENQRNMCMVLLTEKDDIRMAEVGRELGLTRAGVNGIKNQLKIKLQDLIA